MGDARAWLIWALTVLLAASYARNPLHGVVLFLITAWVHARGAVARRDGSRLSPLRFALIVVPLAAVLNGLATRVGETVLVRLPAWLPLIRGPITAEALVYGAGSGLSLATILSGFSAFNRALAVRDLMHLVPRAFHELAVVMSISLTFVPQATRSVRRIREAQAVRGHRLKGLRDWAPIITPLLTSALERAFQLAESMVARGYAGVARAAQGRARVLLTSGLAIVLCGWLGVLLVPVARTASMLVLGLGAMLVAAALWVTGRSAGHTTYRPSRWRARDTLIAAGCLPTLVLVLTQRELLHWSPYPRLGLPDFDPVVGLLTLGLVVPALLSSASETEGDDPD